MVCGWCIINDGEIYLNMEGRVATSQDGTEPRSQTLGSNTAGGLVILGGFKISSAVKMVLLSVYKFTQGWS